MIAVLLAVISKQTINNTGYCTAYVHLAYTVDIIDISSNTSKMITRPNNLSHPLGLIPTWAI